MPRRGGSFCLRVVAGIAFTTAALVTVCGRGALPRGHPSMPRGPRRDGHPPGAGGRKAANGLVTTSVLAANSYSVAGRPPLAAGRAVAAVGRMTLRRDRIRCRLVADTG